MIASVESMLRKLWKAVLLVVVIVTSVLGVKNLRFETDILEVLPRSISTVEALKNYSHHFSRERELVVLLRSEQDEVEEDDVAALVDYLREKLPEMDVRDRSSLAQNPELLATSVARIWSYAPPEQVEVLLNRFENGKELEAHLEQVKSNIGSSFDQQRVMTQAYDPLGFLEHPSLVSLMDGEMNLTSDDGNFRLIFVRQKVEEDIGYKADSAWMQKIRNEIDRGLLLEEVPLSYQLTGGPAFNAEIGTGMERDMSGTMTLTSILIVGLFLLVQRNVRQLLLISTVLSLTFLITLGIGGWLFGTLNLVSVGFAAILLGLVIDYSVVIARESSEHSFSAKGLREMLSPSILWAAGSTAVVFGILQLSTFTGVQQLGALVAIGLLVGALVSLTIAPLFFEKFPAGPSRRMTTPPFISAARCRLIPPIILLVVIAIFVTKGSPRVSFDLKMVEPESSEAAAAFTSIQEGFGAWSDRNVVLISTAASTTELRAQAASAQVSLLELENDGTVVSSQWPVDLIPNAENFQTNRKSILRMLERQQMVVGAASAAGFSTAGLGLGEGVFAAFSELPRTIGELEKSCEADPLVSLFYSMDDQNRSFFSGRMLLGSDLSAGDIEKFDKLSETQVEVTSWTVLQVVLSPYVKRDFYAIFIPAALLLLGALFLVFRGWMETLISLVVLTLALVLINAVVVCTGQPWNFLSGMAIPLIVGAGIDYSIHLIFALRRLDGDFSAVWNGVGKAIFFCGTSTAIGFSSLLFASNKMLQSMGLLCSVGVLLTMILSLLLIPGMWQWSQARRAKSISGNRSHKSES